MIFDIFKLQVNMFVLEMTQFSEIIFTCINTAYGWILYINVPLRRCLRLPHFVHVYDVVHMLAERSEQKDSKAYIASQREKMNLTYKNSGYNAKIQGYALV